MNLSLCMIVKNEDDCLADCLESVKDAVDEIVILDTGSTDNTIEIAKQYTKKIFSAPWENDFSKARNECLLYASGKQVLWLDADDKLSPEARDAIKVIRGLGESDVAYFFTIHNVNCSEMAREWENDYLQMKIFPRRPDIYFVNAIHETVEHHVIANKKIEVRVASVIVDHYGYIDEMKLKRKIMRDMLVSYMEQATKNVGNPSTVHFELNIGKYFFFYAPNTLSVFGNRFDVTKMRIVMKKIETCQPFQFRKPTSDKEALAMIVSEARCIEDRLRVQDELEAAILSTELSRITTSNMNH
jgi:glycosyltransferase involved in cell wall biosynthesis